MFLKPYLHAHTLVYICRLSGDIRRFVPSYAGLGFLLAFIFQNYIFSSLKSYIFHFNISQVNLQSDWALDQPWVLEIQHHWGIGAKVVRGTKCGVYRCHSFDSWALFMKLKESKTTFCFNVWLRPNLPHDTHHAYMERGVTPQSGMGFVCLKSHDCYSRNEQW